MGIAKLLVKLVEKAVRLKRSEEKRSEELAIEDILLNGLAITVWPSGFSSEASIKAITQWEFPIVLGPPITQWAPYWPMGAPIG